MRGKCPRCGYSVRIRKNGYAQRHSLYAGNGRFTCPGGEFMRPLSDVAPYPIAKWLTDWRSDDHEAEMIEQTGGEC